MGQATELSKEYVQYWSQHLQRRVMRLLLQHDEVLFRQQFRLFYTGSMLPAIPLLQQYDAYLRLRTLSNELLDDILPRIRRQLSLHTEHMRLREEAPTRGDIDWLRTLERSGQIAPGQHPLQFETRLRQRSQETPENILVVALLLAFHQEVQHVITEQLLDEDLGTLEQQTLSTIATRTERELSAAYARALLPQAKKVACTALVQQVSQHLRPGPNPYRDLIQWWQRFDAFRTGRLTESRALSLAPVREDEKSDAWLYELWIILELLHLLSQEESITSGEITVATDTLQCVFTWQQRRFRLLYNRQLDTSTNFTSTWEHAPSSRPDYTIEREEPLEIRHQGTLIWREPPVIFDAKYYLTGSDPTLTDQPIKKLLGDMTLLHAQVGMLLFPTIAEPTQTDEQSTRIVQQKQEQSKRDAQKVYLYHIYPEMPYQALQKRLRALLNCALHHLPERPVPICQGILLDRDTINTSNFQYPPETILCPKPHIGKDSFDLVNARTDCLQNPYLCHVIGQAIVPPFVSRVTSQTQLIERISNLWDRNHEHLSNGQKLENEVQREGDTSPPS